MVQLTSQMHAAFKLLFVCVYAFSVSARVCLYVCMSVCQSICLSICLSGGRAPPCLASTLLRASETSGMRACNLQRDVTLYSTYNPRRQWSLEESIKNILQNQLLEIILQSLVLFFLVLVLYLVSLHYLSSMMPVSVLWHGCKEKIL